MSRLLNMIAKAVPRRLSDLGKRQTMQVEVTRGELIDDIERMQNYGYTSSPPLGGTDCLVAFLGGNREQGVVIVAENRQYRLTGLESGEVALFDDLGNVVKLGRSAIEVQAVTQISLTAPTIQIEGNIVHTGTLVSNGKDIGSTHYHVGSTPDKVPA